MDVSSYFRSLSQELAALKDRVRYLIADQHWQTDGEWKESVLRSTLRRHLPASVGVGSGFLVAPKTASQQIDLLVYDSAKPVLFKDGDLIFLASDAAQAIIEVKAKIHDMTHLQETLTKLANKAAFIHGETPGDQFRIRPPFIGLFAYEWDGDERHAGAVMNALVNAACYNKTRKPPNPHTRIVNHVALGPSFFVRYWDREPSSDRGADYCSWHAYHLQQRAFGYFLHNIVDSVSSQAVSMNPELWFPEEGKEVHFISGMGLYGEGTTSTRRSKRNR